MSTIPPCEVPSISELTVYGSVLRFVRIFFASFLPSMLQDGVAFEAHPQNAVARFSLAPPHELRGFIIRDFGGLRVHPPTLLASTGVTLDVAPGHSIVAETLDDVYTRMIPRGHPLERAWLGEEAKTIPGKCYMRMRLVGAYRHVSFLALVCNTRSL